MITTTRHFTSLESAHAHAKLENEIDVIERRIESENKRAEFHRLSASTSETLANKLVNDRALLLQQLNALAS